MKLIHIFITSLALVLSSSFAADTKKPNVVVILSDDFGYGSLGCYGGPAELKTPHLDRLAREGRKFTQAYAPGSVCSPTRYALLTGRYFWRTSVKGGGTLSSGSPLHIEPTRLTLASLCKGQGYATAAVGKWHLGMGAGGLSKKADWSVEIKPGPLEVGFDYFFGLVSNPWSGPHTFIENHHVLNHLTGQPVIINGGKAGSTTSGLSQQWQEDHLMESLTGKAVGWVEQHAHEPFFLYFAPNAVHLPIVPKADFTGSKFGIYGDFIEELDWSVGQVLGALDRLQLADDTLVIFTSDNGGEAGRGHEEIAKALDAGLAINGALRGGKSEIWEGGFREPFLARWPGKVPAGTVSEQVICHTDILATLAHVLEVPLPRGQAEDSFDILRTFTEEKPGVPVREHVILQAADATYAIRMGDWKLIERADAPPIEPRNQKRAEFAERKAKKAPKFDEMFNLKDDSAEATNVLASQTDRAAQMKKQLTDARDHGFTRADAEDAPEK
ncbi:MAG: arylsulfatase [Verrucomicrobiales bacterium]